MNPYSCVCVSYMTPEIFLDAIVTYSPGKVLASSDTPSCALDSRFVDDAVARVSVVRDLLLLFLRYYRASV